MKEHIVIKEDRSIASPSTIKNIGVQYDHNASTLIFDCPRYNNDIDMSDMQIYINYTLADGTKGCKLADNVRVDEKDENIIHFDWTITRNVTKIDGQSLSWFV